MKLLDCTLRDGANVLGKGFPADLTVMMLEGLIKNNIRTIEFGNAGGIGAYEVSNFIAPLNDEQYMDIAKPYLDQAEIGMFLNAKRYLEKNVDLAAQKGLRFIRVGADAGDGSIALDAIRAIKKRGLKAFYSIMKVYLLNIDELLEEAKMLQNEGLDEITMMDSAGTMLPDQVAHYSYKMANALHIPVGFHGHNNLGLSAANALAAAQNGVEVLDCGLLGMARSAGNLATEVAATLLQRLGKADNIDLYGLLAFLERKLIPAMQSYGYCTSIKPLDLVLGYSGCHSSFVALFRDIAKEKGVNLYKLIAEVSLKNRKAPSEELIRTIADSLPVESCENSR